MEFSGLGGFCYIHIHDLGALPLQVRHHLENTKLILVTVTYDKCYLQEAKGEFTGERIKAHQDLPSGVRWSCSSWFQRQYRMENKCMVPGTTLVSSQLLHLMAVRPWEKILPLSLLPFSHLYNQNIGSIDLIVLLGIFMCLKCIELSLK